MQQPGPLQGQHQLHPFQGQAAPPNLPQQGPLPGLNQMDPQIQAAVQAILRGIQTSAAPHSATSVPPRPQVPQQQVRIPPAYAPIATAETNPTTSYDPSTGYMRGLESTYGSVTVPYTTNTASSSTIMAAASGGGGITTTVGSLSYTQLEPVVGGSDNLSTLAMPGGSTPILDASRSMESPGFMQQYLGNTSGLGSALSTPTSGLLTPSHAASLNTPTHDPRVRAEDVDNTGSRPPSGKGNNDDNDNI